MSDRIFSERKSSDGLVSKGLNLRRCLALDLRLEGALKPYKVMKHLWNPVLQYHITILTATRLQAIVLFLRVYSVFHYAFFGWNCCPGSILFFGQCIAVCESSSNFRPRGKARRRYHRQCRYRGRAHRPDRWGWHRCYAK